MYVTVIDAEMGEVWQYKLPEDTDNWEHEDYEEFVRMDKGHSSSIDWLITPHFGVKTED